MAWERNFEKRVLDIREKELKLQRLNYIMEVRSLMMLKSRSIKHFEKFLWNGIW